MMGKRTGLALAIALGMTVPAAAQDTWAQRAPTTDKMSGHGMVEVNGKIYMFGGVERFTGAFLSKTWEYDPAIDSWTLRAPMPSAVAYMGFAALGGKVYCVGGKPPTSSTTALASVHVYDPATDAWSSATPMPTARWYVACAATSTRLYACGGQTYIGGYKWLATVEEYDPSTNSWTAKAPLPQALGVPFVGGISDKVYIAAGVYSGYTMATYEYDPPADLWTRKADMPSTVSPGPYGGASAIIGGRLLCFGGWNAGTSMPRNTLAEYRPSTNTWVMRANAPETLYFGSGAAAGGKAYFNGGTSSFPYKSTLEYTPAFPVLTELQQLDRDGIAIPQGGVVGGTVRFEGRITYAGSVRFEVELRSVDDPFLDIATSIGPLSSQGVHSVVVAPPPGQYKWQVRLVPATGTAEAWMPFGSADPDFEIATPPQGNTDREGPNRCSLAATDAGTIALLAPALLLAMLAVCLRR